MVLVKIRTIINDDIATFDYIRSPFTNAIRGRRWKVLVNYYDNQRQKVERSECNGTKIVLRRSRGRWTDKRNNIYLVEVGKQRVNLSRWISGCGERCTNGVVSITWIETGLTWPVHPLLSSCHPTYPAHLAIQIRHVSKAVTVAAKRINRPSRVSTSSIKPIARLNVIISSLNSRCLPADCRHIAKQHLDFLWLLKHGNPIARSRLSSFRCFYF